MVSTNGTKVVNDRVDSSKVDIDEIDSETLNTETIDSDVADETANLPDGENDPGAQSTNEDGAENRQADNDNKKNKEKRNPPKRKRREKVKEPKIHKAVIAFQPDAIEIERRSVAGGLRWTLYVVVLLLVSLVVWASWAQVDRIVSGRGKLATKSNPIVIQPGSTMPIVDIYVKFGDVVEAGQKLAKLDPTFSEADVKKLESDLEGTKAIIARLTAEMEGNDFVLGENADNEKWQIQRDMHVARIEALESKKSEFAAGKQKLLAEKETNTQEIKNLNEQLEFHRKLVEKFTELNKSNATSEVQLMESKIKLNQAQRIVDTAENRATEIKYEIEANEKQIAAHVADWRSKTSGQLAEAKQKFYATQEDLNKALHMQDMVFLTVPNDLPYKKFFVLEVAERSAGSVARVGDPIFKLVPLNADLEIELEIQGKDIGRLVVGDEVRIKLPSFPYQKHGTLKGRLARISEGSFEKGEGPVTQTFYRARIELTETKLENIPDDVRLMPGMNADCEIKIGKRRVIEYFIYPLIRYFDSSIREP